MGLKCPDCGSENTIIVDKENIENIANSMPAAALGCIMPMEKKIVKETFFFICEDCGYWEEVEVKKTKEEKSLGFTNPFPFIIF